MTNRGIPSSSELSWPVFIHSLSHLFIEHLVYVRQYAIHYSSEQNKITPLGELREGIIRQKKKQGNCRLW